MLPTPSKSHYTFNLRDISKVMQGMLQIRTAKCADADGLVRLWVHEASRVFCDRLVDDDDRAWFNNKLAAIIKETEGLGGREWDPTTFPGITFGSYMQSSAGADQARDELLRLP